MKERGIIFTGDSVRGLLDGRKTQTRRIVRGVPPDWKYDGWIKATSGEQARIGGRIFFNGREPMADTEKIVHCPHGWIGDRLWVRETFRLAHKTEWKPRIIYRASDPNAAGAPWKSPYHMKREWSRITLEITKVWVERLQDISQRDAQAEGVYAWPIGSTPRRTYAHLWDSLHGEGAWDKNPWVFVIEFKPV